jgi:hypothetical protein
VTSDGADLLRNQGKQLRGYISVTAKSVSPLSAKPHAIPSQKLAVPSEPRRRAIAAIAAGTSAIQSKAAPVCMLTLFSGGSRGRLTTPCHLGVWRAVLVDVADAGLGFHVYVRIRRVFARS